MGRRGGVALAFGVAVAVGTLAYAFTREGAPSEPTAAARPAAAPLSARDADVQRALILDAALARADLELAELEAASPRDDAAIAEKREARAAVAHTLAQLQRRIAARDARSR